MVNLRARSQIVTEGDTVQLKIFLRDAFGGLVDADSFPTVSIVQPSGLVALNPTSVGVYKIDTGTYAYDYEIGLQPSFGVWNDIWVGYIQGIQITGEYNFVVHNTEMPHNNTDGYLHLGDDPGFCYSQIAIRNINSLMKTLRARLDSRGKSRVMDDNGNSLLVDCDIFSVDQLTSFLANSLSMFNEIPHFTFFQFEDTQFIKQFHNILVQGAVIMALSGKSLLERGREFTFNDQGISWTIPSVSELMNSQWAAELQSHTAKVIQIKASMKPSGLGIGSFSITASRNPAISRLRHIRGRQII